MGWREFNDRSVEVCGRHPVRYAVAMGAALACLHLGMNAVWDRPFNAPAFVIATIIFPALSAIMVRHRYRAGMAPHE